MAATGRRRADPVRTGHIARAHGESWEQEIRGQLHACVLRGEIDDWEQRGVPAKYVHKGGRMELVPLDGDAVGRGRPVDFACWSPSGAWFFEAKHQSSARWEFRQLKLSQAERGNLRRGMRWLAERAAQADR